MRGRRHRTRAAAALGLVTVLASLPSGPAQAASSADFAYGIFGNESVATTDGASGFDVNPAAGGLRYPAELMLSYTDLERADRSLLRGIGSWGGFGFGLAHDRDALQAYSLALALGDAGSRWGARSRLLVSEPAGDRAWDLVLGWLSRPAVWLSLGATVEHVGQPRLGAELLERDYAMGIGLRPLAFSTARAHDQGPRLTLTADLRMREGEERGQARVRVGAELEVVDGIVLRGSAEDHGRLQVGLSLLGVHGAFHSQSAHDEDRRTSTSHTLSFHSGEDASFLAGPSARRVAELRITGSLGDDTATGFSLDGTGTTPVRPIHDRLERALEDPRTRGVLLDVRGITGMAQVEELRPRIARLRAAGKPVVAYLEEGATRAGLYLASACDRIVTTEEAGFWGLGLRVERRYYRAFLERLGIQVDRSAWGRFKSAYREYGADSSTAEERAQIDDQLDRFRDLFEDAISRDRGIAPDRVAAMFEGQPWTGGDARRLGLADSVGDRATALAVLGGLCRLGERPRAARLERISTARREWARPTRLAVVYAWGGIETGSSGMSLLEGPTLGSETAMRQLERAFEDSRVRAVVLRIESPGGSTTASHLIDHAARRMRKRTGKPLVVSMGSVAASGGYHIALGADRIFADRFTRTGSIGVLIAKPSLEGLYAKLGVRQEDFDRGRYMRGWSLARDWDAELQAIADSAIHASYLRFVHQVATARHLSPAHVDSIAQGRVWMGEDAVRHGLVDAIGGLEEAIAEARRRGGIPAGQRIRIAEYRRPRPSLFERLAASAFRGSRVSLGLPQPGALYYESNLSIHDEAEP